VRRTKPLEKTIQPLIALPSIAQFKTTKKVQLVSDSEHKQHQRDDKKSVIEAVEDSIEALIQTRMENLPHNGFIYLKYSVSQNSVKYTPYSLM